MITPVLTTERLVLRGWRDVDADPYTALNADPYVMEHFPSTLTSDQSVEMIDRMTQSWRVRGYGLWAVEVVPAASGGDVGRTGGFIGFVGLASPTWEMPFTPCVEVGWRLARHAWGHGYAPEAARVALTWGFANVDLPGDEIVSFTTAGNTKSRRVMEKIGMHHDPADDFDHPLLPHWEHKRHVLYRIGRDTG